MANRTRMDQVLAAIYRSPDEPSKGEWIAGSECRPTLSALYGMRVLPLLCARLQKGDRHALDGLNGLLHIIGLVHRHLLAELEWFIATCDELGVPVVPIKGTHQMLWGLGQRSELHTRDVDLLIKAADYEQVSCVLLNAGYRQLGWLSLTTGQMRDITPDELAMEEPAGYYGYFPWTKLIRVPELVGKLSVVYENANPGGHTYPIIIIDSEPHVAVQFDLHHSLWPGVPFGALQIEESTYGSRSIRALSLCDRLVFHSAHMATRLMGSSWRPGWGAFAQLVFTMQTEANSSVYEECLRRASEVNLKNQWLSVAGLIQGLARRCNVELSALPSSSDFVMDQAETDYVQRWSTVLD